MFQHGQPSPISNSACLQCLYSTHPHPLPSSRIDNPNNNSDCRTSAAVFLHLRHGTPFHSFYRPRSGKTYHITIYVQRFFHLHRPPSSVLCLHMHSCNISVPDHTGAGRKTPCRTPDRSLTARSSSSLVSGGCCSTVTGIPVSRTSVVCLYGLVRLPYRTEGRRKTPCP